MRRLVVVPLLLALVSCSRDLSFEELDALWDAAKADERREATAS